MDYYSTLLERYLIFKFNRSRGTLTHIWTRKPRAKLDNTFPWGQFLIDVFNESIRLDCSSKGGKSYYLSELQQRLSRLKLYQLNPSL